MTDIEKVFLWCNEHDILDTELADMIKMPKAEVLSILDGVIDPTPAFWKSVSKVTGLILPTKERTYKEKLDYYLNIHGITRNHLVKETGWSIATVKRALLPDNKYHEKILDVIDQMTGFKYERTYKIDKNNESALPTYVYDMLMAYGNTVISEKTLKKIGGPEALIELIKEKYGIECIYTLIKHPTENGNSRSNEDTHMIEVVRNENKRTFKI